MKYVLDSSIAFKWLVPEPDSDKATALWDDYRSAIHDLVSPDVFPQELAHALTRAERLVFAHPLPAYDALQLACALRAAEVLVSLAGDCRFCTADRAQSDAARSEGLTVAFIE